MFAIVRETSKRILHMRHYDVQILGGLALHSGNIIEMNTGEGKTLSAILPAILNSMLNLSVHIITVNDYLASRDVEWMNKVYRFFNIQAGVILPNMTFKEKKNIYSFGVVYGQNNTFGFDYLKNNMQFSISNYIQTNFFFAIVDEVDSILIDEARTPLIISGTNSEENNQYIIANKISLRFKKNIDFYIDQKEKNAFLSEVGINKLDRLFDKSTIYVHKSDTIGYCLIQSIKAHYLFFKNVHYIIDMNKIVIIDEYTGRLMHGRIWSNGLHQALEAKEGLAISSENQTLAKITFQNYFRMYKKLSGMTGTASTEVNEFYKIYNLNVVKIPSNKYLIRHDEYDKIYRTKQSKYNAIINDVSATNAIGQPVLVGTVSINQSEYLFNILNNIGIHSNILNAKLHKYEAEIIAQAGLINQVTIATNMAGRGTDIILGGNLNFFSAKKTIDLFAKRIKNQNYSIFLKKYSSFENIGLMSKRQMNLNFSIWKASLKYSTLSIYQIVNVKKYIVSLQKYIFIDQLIFFTKCSKIYYDTKNKYILRFLENRKKILILGGLRIIGTEKHESRRVDNQLKGRAGRQGDPGESGFYISLEDDLMKNFGGDNIKSMINKMGLDENINIQHPWISKSINKVQKKIEDLYFNYRQQLLEFDDILELQRCAIYTLRKQILTSLSLKQLIFKVLNNIIDETFTKYIYTSNQSSKKIKALLLHKDIWGLFRLQKTHTQHLSNKVYLYRFIKHRYSTNSNMFKYSNNIEKYIFMHIIDKNWQKHLVLIERLRDGIHLRGYAQKDPKEEYKRETYDLFRNMIYTSKYEILKTIFNFFYMYNYSIKYLQKKKYIYKKNIIN